MTLNAVRKRCFICDSTPLNLILCLVSLFLLSKHCCYCQDIGVTTSCEELGCDLAFCTRCIPFPHHINTNNLSRLKFKCPSCHIKEERSPKPEYQIDCDRHPYFVGTSNLSFCILTSSLTFADFTRRGLKIGTLSVYDQPFFHRMPLPSGPLSVLLTPDLLQSSTWLWME